MKSLKNWLVMLLFKTEEGLSREHLRDFERQFRKRGYSYTFRAVIVGCLVLLLGSLSLLPIQSVLRPTYQQPYIWFFLTIQVVSLVAIALLSSGRGKVGRCSRAITTGSLFLVSIFAANLAGVVRDNTVSESFPICVHYNESDLVCEALNSNLLNASVSTEQVLVPAALWGFFGVRSAVEQGMDILHISLLSGFAENILFPFNVFKLLSYGTMIIRIIFAIVDSNFLLSINIPFAFFFVIINWWQTLLVCGLCIGFLIRRAREEESLVNIFLERLKNEERDTRTLYQTIEETKLELEEKQAFVATVAHEVRTPLHGIVTLVDLLQTTAVDETEIGYLASLRSSVQSLVLLVNDVLDISKLDSGRLELNLQETNLNTLVRECCRSYYLFAVEKGLELGYNIDFPSIPGRALCDGLRITQVLNNLVSNAIKFSSSGSICIRLRGGEIKPLATWMDEDGRAARDKECPNSKCIGIQCRVAPIETSLQAESACKAREVIHCLKTHSRKQGHVNSVTSSEPSDGSELSRGYLSAIYNLGVSPDTLAQEFIFEVEDEGIGIDAEWIPRLFERFSKAYRHATSLTSKKASPRDSAAPSPSSAEGNNSIVRGTGLGLSICKEIAGLMGGNLSVNSKKGKGSTFRAQVVLPLLQQREPRGRTATDDALQERRDHCMNEYVLSTSSVIQSSVKGALSGAVDSEDEKMVNRAYRAFLETRRGDELEKALFDIKHPTIIVFDVPPVFTKRLTESTDFVVKEREQPFEILQSLITLLQRVLQRGQSGLSGILLLVPMGGMVPALRGGRYGQPLSASQDLALETLNKPASVKEVAHNLSGLRRRVRVTRSNLQLESGEDILTLGRSLMINAETEVIDEAESALVPPDMRARTMMHEAELFQRTMSRRSDRHSREENGTDLCPSGTEKGRELPTGLCASRPPTGNTIQEEPSTVGDDQDSTRDILKKHRVLIVDDERICRRVAQLMLKSLGIPYEMASNGVECLQAMEASLSADGGIAGEGPFTAVLMDYQMPLKDGIETTRDIRSRDWIYKDIPVIGASAGVDSDEATASGMSTFLPKPFQQIDLASALLPFSPNKAS